jgi:hypothetical protein
MRRLRRVLGLAMFLGVAAHACSDETANVGVTGSAGGDVCSVGKDPCDFACSADVGCADCVDDRDCGPGEPICVLGRCRACGDTGDCGTGQACWPKDHACRPSCTGPADCGGDEPICDAASSACIGCRKNADCTDPKKPVCEPTRAHCGACASRGDCGVAKPACDLSRAECVECLVDGDCRSGYLCGKDRKCHAACRSNADCHDPKKPLCRVTTGACVACLENRDCPAAAPICRSDGKCGG